MSKKFRVRTLRKVIVEKRKTKVKTGKTNKEYNPGMCLIFSNGMEPTVCNNKSAQAGEDGEDLFE